MRSVLVFAMALGCGTSGNPGGPPENAPFTGSSGYDKVEGTYVITDSRADLTEPAVVADSPDGPFAIWMTWNGNEIRRSDLPRLTTDPTVPRPAFQATESWEAGRVAAPSIERDSAGWHMAYEAGDGIIALADSPDGETWSHRRMLGPGHRPSLARGRVFYDDGQEIWLAPFGSQTAAFVLQGTAPDVHVRRTAAERDLWQMFFNCPGTDRISTAICYAGSLDGVWFDTTEMPILQPKQPDELGPAAIVGDIRATLFFAQQPTGLPSRIGAATAPAAAR